MRRKILEVSLDQDLNEVFTKAHYLETADVSIAEGTLQFLIVEKINEEDAKKVSDALAASREQVEKIENYLKGLKSKGLDLNDIPTIVTMVRDLKKALDKAQGDFAIVNFGSDSDAKFMGIKMKVPGIVKAAIAIQSKANKFLTGFTDALQNIETNLVPLAKGADKKVPLRDLTGQGGVPEEEALEKSILKAIKDSLDTKQGFFSKIGDFIGKQLGSSKSKILKVIPDLDVTLAATELSQALLDSPLSIFDSADIKDTKVPKAGIGDIVKDLTGGKDDNTKSSGEKSSDKGGSSNKEIDDVIAQLKALIKDKEPERAKEIEAAPAEEVKAALEDDAEDVLKGKDLEAAAEEAAEEGIQGSKWSDISKSYVDSAVDKDAAKKLVDTLAADKNFQDAVSGKINLGESFAATKLSDYLFEDVPFETISKAAKKSSDDFLTQDELAQGMVDTLDSANIEVTGIPAEKAQSGTKPEVGGVYKYTTNKGKELEVKIEKIFDDGDVFAMRPDGKGGFKKPPFRFPGSKLGEKVETQDSPKGSEENIPPATEKEAKKEQEKAQEKLKTAVAAKSKKPQAPKDAALGALDAWTKGLSATSQSELKASNRLSDLKDVVGMALDDASKAVESEVSTAIKMWREEHEEQLVKNNRFAKKNFDDLEKMIATLAGSMLKKANESKFGMTKENIRKIVFEFLNRKFYKNSDKVLLESKAKSIEEKLIIHRMNRMAGLQ